MSEEDGATKRLLERVDYYIKSSKIKIKLGTDSKEGYSFPETNSTMWIGTAGQKAFGRGDDITHLHCSEYLFYPNFWNLNRRSRSYEKWWMVCSRIYR